jgi:hypothetical protein
MKFSAFGLMKSTPGFTMVNKIDPVDIDAKLSGGLKAQVGEISVAIGEVPVKVRIPFLRRRRNTIVIGSVGGTHVKVDPVSLSIDEIAVSFAGILGKAGKGITVKTDAKVDCRTEMEARGDACGRIGLGSVDLGGEECRDELKPERPRHDDRKRK